MRSPGWPGLLVASACLLPVPAWADPPARADMITLLSGFERGPEIDALRNWGAASTRTLMDIAEDARALPHVRVRALYALRAFPGELSARDFLRVVANDVARPLLLRRAAFDALAEGFADVETLARWLRDPASDVRDGAAWAIARVHTPVAHAALEVALRTERDETVRITLRTALQSR
ncbi:MAG: HEAT repeat domain-containing protein [Deltaproteobacteria bacterium]